MTTDPVFRKRYLDALAATPQILGSTGSRLLSGATPAHDALERRIAHHMGSQDALLFHTGWEGNVCFFGTVPQKHDWIIYDELMHASFYSGLAISKTPPKQRIRMRHNSVASLTKALRHIVAQGGLNTTKDGLKPTIFLVCESIYSMDGDFAPLPAFIDTMDAYIPKDQQCNFVDEAHSTAMYGEGGRGICWALGPEYRNRVHVRLMTFGKAVGTAGSALLLTSMVKLYITNFAWSVIFSTAPPHSLLVAVRESWDMLASPEGDAKRQEMYDNIAYFNSLVDRVLSIAPANVLRRPEVDGFAPFPAEAATQLPEHPPSAVVALCTPDPDALYEFALERGFILSSIIPPAVPPGQERIRICLRAGMEKRHMDRLAQILVEYIQSKVQTDQVPAKL